jgi:hypothetical protein
MTALTSTSMQVIFRRKEFDNCSLFRNLVFIPTIAENLTSQMYEDEKGSRTVKASVILFCFFIFPFLMIFNFYIIKISQFKNFSPPITNRLATHQFGKRCFRALNVGKLIIFTTYLATEQG